MFIDLLCEYGLDVSKLVPAAIEEPYNIERKPQIMLYSIPQKIIFNSSWYIAEFLRLTETTSICHL